MTAFVKTVIENTDSVTAEISSYQTLSGEFNDRASTTPIGAPVNMDLRFSLIKEEVEETKKAIVDRNEVEIIDGACDVLYVTYGCAHVLGIVLDTKRYETQPVTNKVDWEGLDASITDFNWQLHWIQTDMAKGDLVALKRDLEELAIECLELGFKGLGLDLYPFYKEVHRTNMLKFDGPKRADGKQLKPEGWQPPRITEMLKEVRASSALKESLQAFEVFRKETTKGA